MIYLSTKKTSPAQASRIALAEAITQQDNMKQTHDTAVAHADALRQRLATGDQTVTADELTLADAEVERTGILARSAARAVEVAKRALINDDYRLAAAITATLSAMLDVPVVSDLDDDRPAMPYAVLSQPRATEVHLIKGTVSGHVNLAYHRTGHHRDLLDAEAMKTRLAAGGVLAEVRAEGSGEHDGHLVDRCRIDVRVASEQVPVLRYNADDGHVISHFRQFVASDVADALQESTASDSGIVLGSGVTGRARTVTARAAATVVADGSTRGVRQRKVRVTVAVEATQYARYANVQTFLAALHPAVEALRGRFYSQLGRVESVTNIDVKVTGIGSRPAGTVAAEVTFVSRLPEGSDEVPAFTSTAPVDVPGQRSVPTSRAGGQPGHPGFTSTL